MVALLPPTDEEAYLYAILKDPTGIDLAEFCWVEESNDDGCFRLWDFQWAWQANMDSLQADSCGRAVGKSVGIQMRAFAFPFNYPGQEMLITAPELNHLRPVVDKVEGRILSVRMSRELLPNKKGKGINRQPQWQARFDNGSVILSRLPNKDGKGVKGIHSTVIELDEGQDYPPAGWTEIIESRNRWAKGSIFRVHGVARGVRDKFWEITQPDSQWTVHRQMAMMRPGWSPEERAEKVELYGGTRQNPDYRRNIYGEHGDATNPVFVLARLMACVDKEEGSTFNDDVYQTVRISFEELESEDNKHGQPLESFFSDLPGTHLVGWQDGRKKVSYNAFYGGMDVGLTNHPSEILIFGERGDGHLDLLLRVHLQRIDEEEQRAVVRFLFEFYGKKLKRFAIDRGGVGFPIYQSLVREFGQERMWGWTFDEKVVVGFEDRELENKETMEDLAEYRPLVEHATDVLRNEYVDPARMLLPFDREVLTEWQGQSYAVVKSAGNPYGKRSYSQGAFHCLDAAKLAMAAKTLPPLIEMMEEPEQEEVLDVFLGAGML